MVSTSTPWSTRLLAASASLDGIDQSPVKMTAVVAFGLTERAPSVNELMLRRTWGMGLAAMNPSLFDFVVMPATIPETYCASSM